MMFGRRVFCCATAGIAAMNQMAKADKTKVAKNRPALTQISHVLRVPQAIMHGLGAL